MSLLQTMLGAANVVESMRQTQQLSQLRIQGAAQEAIATLILALRNQIFRYKQAIDNILSAEGRISDKHLAATLKILELRLTESGISPEFFLELGDKEYAASTFRSAHEHSRRIFERLSAAEQVEVVEIVTKADTLEDISFYTDNFELGKKYLAAAKSARTLAPRNNGVAAAVMQIASVLICILLALGLGSATGSSAVGWSVLLLSLSTALFYFNPVEFRDAKEEVNKISAKLNAERFLDLHGRLGEDLAQLEQIKNSLNASIQSFFASDINTVQLLES